MNTSNKTGNKVSKQSPKEQSEHPTRIIVSEYSLDMGIFGDQMVNIYGHNEVQPPEPEVGVGYSPSVEVHVIEWILAGSRVLLIPSYVLEDGDLQSLETDVEEYLREEYERVLGEIEGLGGVR